MTKYHKVVMNCNEWTEDGPEYVIKKDVTEQKSQSNFATAMLTGSLIAFMVVIGTVLTYKAFSKTKN